MKGLVIGLDAACLSVLDWMSEGDTVPNLDEVRESGTVAPLESQLPPWTPSAWPSMYTGVNPGKHGVYDFFRFEGYEWDVVNRTHVQEFAIWELLSMHGYSSVVVNVPVTHQPREFDGVLVPGYIAPERATCHPTGVWDELERTLGEYSLYGGSLDASSSDELAETLVDLSRMRGQAFRYLVDQYDPEFGFVQFQTTDTVFHQFPGDEAITRRVYGAVDTAVGKILDSLDPEMILLVSDHGIGPMEGREFRVNNFLREEGWLTSTAEGGGMPSWKSITREAENDNGEDSTVGSLATSGIELAARAGLTGQRISGLLERLGVRDQVLEVVPAGVIRAGIEQVDFPASTAYMRSRTEMGVRLNLDGREPNGTVPQSDYERVRNEVMKALASVEIDTGEPVFEAVLPREEVFEGPHLDDAPDIVTVPNRFDHFLVANLKGSTFGEPTEPYEHKRNGVVIADGPKVDSAADLTGAHLFDIAPTILAGFALPVSERMDGGPLPIVEATDREPYEGFHSTAVSTDSDAVMERLSALGYLK